MSENEESTSMAGVDSDKSPSLLPPPVRTRTKEKSLRYGGDSKCIRVHTKEKFPVLSNALCQLNGELNLGIGAPYLHGMIKHCSSDLSTRLGVGVEYCRDKKIRCHVRGKKVFPVSDDGSLEFNVKGRYDADLDFREMSFTGAGELSWKTFNANMERDWRLKFGYDVHNMIPYIQIHKYKWTVNAGNHRWEVRYDM